MEPIVRDRLQVLRYTGKSLIEIEDQAAVEYPLTIHIDNEEFATVVCTPANLKELVVGFLASEGMIRNIGDISSLEIDEHQGFAYVELKVKQVISKEYYSKRMIGSCCGKSRQFYFYNDAKTAKTIMSRQKISAGQCLELMEEMQKSSEEFQLTGGVHNAALCTEDELLFSYSDIGRHNALDKIFGHCLINNISLKDKVIVFSGRISSEVVLKVAKIGAGILISKSAPTTLGIDLAHDLGITAIGFARNGQLNIYTHPERIVAVSS
ncbi:formate dehydrogenase accessory sulfurtransferase FdhD [Siminovitchia fortis]|uniref:Sulfur carrier protein FdhD n=1 Tax=Siminovitchia fortis TaxID=254758 RepID=A0A451GBN2_9BACI|nr:formate dehydrogenase accessory sulfurtransferase FdhD [Siminovitchia fortis]RWR12420.1 formate dehydrogenase accessory sulfurtransferase FdhD [Siminovitchia fortis]WHY83467.1 formate dehydrogenase accessory sulfurtransferase FdhD [Siminovitchia fortis]